MRFWSLVPMLAAAALLAALVYGAYASLSSVQTVRIATGSPGGGYYELGTKLEQVLNADFHDQRWEAPVILEQMPSRGSRENIERLVTRQAQIGLVLEGLTLKPKVVGASDIRGLMKLSQSTLHIVAGPHLKRAGKPLTQLTDLLEDRSSSLGRPLRVYLGGRDSATRVLMDLLLEYYQFPNESKFAWDVVEEGSSAQAAKALREGRIDVVCLLVAIGSPAVVDLSHGGMLLSVPSPAVDAIHMLQPALLAATIPAGIYNKDFPAAAVTTLGADDILVANGQVSNRLAYRIVRTIAIHWQELQWGMLLPEDFAKAQLAQNDYYPLHPGAEAYYKGESVPLWPWFEEKVRLGIEHRDVVLAVVGGIPTLYTLLYAWYQRRRVNRLMAQITAMRVQGNIDRSTIEGIRMHALTLMAQGKLSRESYASLNEYIDAHIKQVQAAVEPERRTVRRPPDTQTAARGAQP